MYARVLERKIAVKYAFDHGVSFAFYFDDPDGHVIEVYWPTGAMHRQPYTESFDLATSNEQLLEHVNSIPGTTFAPAGNR